jgi:hypothetical protein
MENKVSLVLKMEYKGRYSMLQRSAFTSEKEKKYVLLIGIMVKWFHKLKMILFVPRSQRTIL